MTASVWPLWRIRVAAFWSRRQRRAENTAIEPLALYIHWPFCKAKCPYCDFNSHVRAEIDEAAWQAGLLRELEHWIARLPDRQLVSIFFGGGTPSLMPPGTVAALIDRATSAWTHMENLEITLEANPTSVEAARLQGFKTAGINRLSMGIQALNDADLKALGRQHSAAEALAALRLATRTFDRVSFDLIYARTGQTVGQWEAELRQALDFGVSHLSLYQLTIEPGTSFAARHAAGDLIVPNEDVAADLYELTQAMTEAAGLPAYEISNHARPGFECRHNLAYWRYEDYVGIGPGAHGRVTLDGVKQATRTHRAPEIWLERVRRDGHALTNLDPVPETESFSERLMMGLRLRDGIDIDIARLPVAALTTLQRHGLAVLDGKRLRATAAGRQRLDSVLKLLLQKEAA